MADNLITEQLNNPSNDNNGVGIFKSALTALRSGRRTTDQSGGGIMPPTSQKEFVEQKQQEFLDWQVSKINEDLYTRTLYYDTDRIAAFQDFRAMDMSPEISAALDILRDECLAGDTVIPLLSGEKVTIEELYNRKDKDFYVYGCNPESKKFEASLCERVTYKGEQDVYKITFDDSSFVEATSEHLWLNREDGEYTKTSDLREGHIIASMYQSNSNEEDRIQGKVVSVEYVGKKKTYDLVNSGKHHNFVVLTSNGTGVVSHNCLTRGENGKIFQIYSQNGRIQTALEDLVEKRLNLPYNSRFIIRDMMKYGDWFAFLDVVKGEGIVNFSTLAGEEVRRIEGGVHEGVQGNIPYYRWDTKGMDLEFWQVAHFRLLEDSRRLPYGRSILDSARKLWKQLQLAEDAMLVYRLVRAPERRVFYIEVGNLEEPDIEQFMMKLQHQLKKQPLVNQNNGNVNYKYDPLNVTEDYFIPVRADRMSKIETLPGATNLGEIQDIEYLEKKLFASLKVPKTYLNYTENLPGGSTLSQADLRFARTVNSIQEAFLVELRRVASIHLHFLGFPEEELENFQIMLNNPSSQQELLKLETMKARVEVFKEYYSTDANSPVSYTWAMENLLGFSKSDIKLLLKQKKIEKRLFLEIDAAAETYKKTGLFSDIDAIYELPNADEIIAGGGAGGDSEGGDDFGGGGGGGLGGGFGGAEELDLGGEDLGGEDLGGETADIPEEPAVEDLAERYKKHENNSERLIDELLGQDVEEIIAETVEDQIQDHKKVYGEAQRLLDSLEREVDFNQFETIMEAHAQGRNPIITKHEMLVKKAQGLIDQIDGEVDGEVEVI